MKAGAHDSSDRGRLIETIAKALKCSTCGRRYRPYDVRLLEQREQLSALVLSCRHCHKHSLVLALVQQKKVRPYLTELDAEEWMWYGRLAPINHDHVVNFHRFIQSYEGDLSDVLEDPLPPDAHGEWDG